MKKVNASNLKRRMAAEQLQTTLASMTRRPQVQPKKMKPSKRHYVKAVPALAVATVAGG